MTADDSYSLKEIIDLTRKEQTQGFASVTTLLASKADKTDVEAIRNDLSSHREETDQRLTRLEADKDLREARAKVHSLRDNQVFSKRQKVWGTVAAIALLLATIGGPIIAAHS